MNIEFHYYITYIIALRAGFKPDDAYVVAYSSQYVDDNSKIFEISPGTANAYSNYISQTLNIVKPKKELMRIYPIFHFMPGIIDDIETDSARRCDGKLHLLNTIPDNRNAQEILQASFNSNNLYRIGIATHIYSDTFAHQNFVGYYDSFNSMRGLLEVTTPDIGHADAKYKPDWPALLWEDKRLVPSHSKVNNKSRFLEAAGRLFEEYRRYLNTTYISSVATQDRDNLVLEIDKAIGDYDGTNEQREDRIARYKASIGENFIDYKKDAWFNEAVRKKIGFLKWNYEWKENYQESHWFKFQEAVKTHQKEAKIILKPIFENMGLENL
ncbi:MAG: DUF6765 family protein [Nitrospirota bacterium]